MGHDGKNLIQKRQAKGSMLSVASAARPPQQFKPAGQTGSVWADSQKRAALQNSFQSGPSQGSSRNTPTSTPRAPKVPQIVVPGPSVPTSEMANVTLGSTVSYNPSEAPMPSIAPGNDVQSRAPTQVSQGTQATYRGAVRNPNCALSGKTKAHFRKGDIISTPYHQPNLVPNTDPNDVRLTHTCEGPVYSKRRMLVVLMVFEQSMYCLPLYTFSGRGLGSRPPWIRKEYVAMRNAEHDLLFPHEPFVNSGLHPHVDVVCKCPVKRETSVQLSGGIKADCCGDVFKIGRMTEDGYGLLLELWQTMSEEAESQPW
ncbi:uncharacterized protein LTR77_008846 [Saxophila tyrrhenica]|uniref:DUF6590 domain-containing protein n=1 Tax=Saxophila tyrrhenica TaxID=1690608 RepID=A0AAV9P0U4_9PEZI|nr:hypothetical protein LTR77_008846 [Saxophila tyrrhenica]